MERIHQLAPLEEQDKLKEELLKTDTGCYVNLYTASLRINGKWDRCGASINQDKLDEGLIKMINDTYIPVNRIELIQEGECFVATVVYGGDVYAPQVQILRNFRDDILEHTPLGKAFIDFYYNVAGRKAANFIKEYLTSTIPIIRRGLDFIVKEYSMKLEQRDNRSIN